MWRRCTEPTNDRYAQYGGRGIRVCERWEKFENFLADMGEPPDGASIDRYPNNDGNYEPGNCRWASGQQQANNKQASRHITIGTVTKPITEWIKATGISRTVLYRRIKAGLDPAAVIASLSRTPLNPPPAGE